MKINGQQHYLWRAVDQCMAPVCVWTSGARWAEVEKLIEYMLEKGDVWFATLEEIAAHVTQCVDNQSYQPRIDTLPYYDQAIETENPDGG